MPESILNGIRFDALKEALLHGREATGMLLGLYSDSMDSLLISDRYTLPSKIGKPTFKTDLLDKITLLLGVPRIHYVTRECELYSRRAMETGRVGGFVFYHTHPSGQSWSSRDLIGILPEHADLLYRVGPDIFEAFNGNREPIPVLKNHWYKTSGI